MGTPTGTRPWADVEDAALARDPDLRALVYDRAIAAAVARAVLVQRQQRGLTQAALGRILGMPQPHVARLELGEHTPTVETIQRVADALDLAIDISIRPQADARRPAPRVARGAIVETTDRLVITIRPAR